MSLGIGIAHSVEVLYFTTELHTSSVQVESSQGQNMDGWMDGWIGWMDGWTDGWTDGQMGG